MARRPLYTTLEAVFGTFFQPTLSPQNCSYKMGIQVGGDKLTLRHNDYQTTTPQRVVNVMNNLHWNIETNHARSTKMASTITHD